MTDLAVVIISDEDDSSHVVVSDVADAIVALSVSRKTPVSVSAVTGPQGRRYHELVGALGGRTLALDGDWGHALATIATDLRALRGRFVLDRAAWVDSVVVDVDGTPVPASAVAVSADGRVVQLSGPIDGGVTVTVTSRPWPFSRHKEHVVVVREERVVRDPRVREWLPVLLLWAALGDSGEHIH